MIGFLLGYCELEIAPDDGALFFELCRERRIAPQHVRRVKNGNIRFWLFFGQEAALLALAGARDIDVHVVQCGGLPVIAKRLLRRPGLLLGLLMILGISVFSRLFLFSVEIVGNERIEREVLMEELAAVGLAPGSFLPSLDEDAIVAGLRQGDARIAYAAVNIHGTVAKIQIREASEEPESAVCLPANLVAKCDGVVTMPLIYEGKCLVQEGDVIRAGQLLASGLIDTERGGVRVTRAAGEVMARTVHTYTVHVPFLYEKKVYTGREGSELSLLFFTMNRKVLKTTGKLTGSCDIIETVKWLTIGDRRFPIGYASASYREFVMEEARYTAEEAYAKAYEELNVLLYQESAQRQIVSRTVETMADADGVTLICTVIAEENIAVTAEFSVQENG